jgi:hypothetical protein
MIIGVDLGVGKVSRTLSSTVIFMKFVGGIALIVFGFYLLLSL